MPPKWIFLLLLLPHSVQFHYNTHMELFKVQVKLSFAKVSFRDA